MASPAKKAKIDSVTVLQRPCPYGAKCYRKNPTHFQEFSHPVNSTDDGSGACSSSLADDNTVPLIDSSSCPPCKYGAKCYRKNLLHFAEYSHPTSTTATDDDNDGDTDPCGSDDDQIKKKDDKDVLNRGMSLVKSFSQMTEAERKELIQKAFEAKQKLQEELAATKKQIEEKDRELNRLQDEINTGMLLVEGEKEALEGKTTVYFPLFPERVYKEGSAAQIHFRLAESQFYRLLSGEAHTQFRVSKVEYVVTPHLVKRFKDARESLKKERGEAMSYPVLGFHGTNAGNITPICEKGFKVPGETGFSHKTDTGWYGAGVYFSEYPSYSMSYISGASKLMLCQVLPGKVYRCTKLIHGAKLMKGYDSHMSPCKKELVIFNSHHILPCYIVHYNNANTMFVYKNDKRKKKGRKGSVTSSHQLDIKHGKAMKAPKSSIFKGKKFQFSGLYFHEKTVKSLQNIVSKHGGTWAAPLAVPDYDIVVAAPTVNENTCTLIQNALQNDKPVVTEEFLYECVIKQKFLDPDYFLHGLYSE